MQPKIIDSKSAQRKILQTLRDLLRNQFSTLEKSDQYDTLGGYFRSQDYLEFGLDLWIRHEWVGINLWGPPIIGVGEPRNILGFASFSPKAQIGATAAAFARDDEGIALYHDGRVYTRDGRARPSRDELMTEINGRKYHKVSNVNDEQFFERIMDFHFSRLNPNLSKKKNLTKIKKGGSGEDAGPSKGGTRSSATFTALHNPITKALRSDVESLGYAVYPCNNVSPDLFVRKEGKAILFEVKPSAGTHDLILACGQVLVYNEDAKADRLIIVSAKSDLTGSNAGIARALHKYGIDFVSYKQVGSKYIFEGLQELIG